MGRHGSNLKAIAEAEAYNGPSLIIGYAPCINHGLKGGMQNSQNEIKKAVKAGYWHLYRYNPDLKKEGKNPFILDSKEPDFNSFRDFLMGEVRYASLAQLFPAEASELFAKTEQDARERYEFYKGLQKRPKLKLQTCCKREGAGGRKSSGSFRLPA